MPRTLLTWLVTAALAAAMSGVLVPPSARAAAGDAQSMQSDDTIETTSDFIATDFKFSDGSVLPQVRIHYTTLGTPHCGAKGDVDNAVLLLHGTTSTSQAFLTPLMRSELFAAGQPLDARRYFIVIPDGLGRGGSSKPSDGLRAHFPRYGYGDVIEANHRLLVEGLRITHLRLVLGTSMGGMQTWMWGERYPEMTDALMPIASQPIAMAGRNWLWRQMIVGAIRNDPGWNGGDYTTRPTQWTRTLPIFALMTGNPARLQSAAPSREAATKFYDTTVADAAKNDPTDVMYWFESSWDYNPEPQLARIRAPLYAVNFADDLINATDLSVMQHVIGAVRHARYVEVPETGKSYGHMTLAHPEVWKPYLVELLRETEHGQAKPGS
jgi:homoserine O-acetyltransferase/O-succinyltransferase